MILWDGHGLSISAASLTGAASLRKCTREFCYCFLKAPRGALSVELSALQQKNPREVLRSSHARPPPPPTPRNLINGGKALLERCGTEDGAAEKL